MHCEGALSYCVFRPIFLSAFRLLRTAGLTDVRIRGYGVSFGGHAPARGSLDPPGCRETRPAGALRQPRFPSLPAAATHWSDWVRSDASPLWASSMGFCSLEWRASYGCAGSFMTHFHDLRANALSVDAYVRHPECRSSCDDAQKGGTVKAGRRWSSAFSPVYDLFPKKIETQCPWADRAPAPQREKAEDTGHWRQGGRRFGASVDPLLFTFFLSCGSCVVNLFRRLLYLRKSRHQPLKNNRHGLYGVCGVALRVLMVWVKEERAHQLKTFFLELL